jgi:hypothetical protein
VAGFFIFAGAAGVDRHIAVILVGNMPREKLTVYPSKDIAKRLKAGKPTGKLNEDAGCRFLKKPWLMHLQQLQSRMIDYLKITRLSAPIVIFAVERVL